MYFFFYLLDIRKRVREIFDSPRLIYTRKWHKKNICIIIKTLKKCHYLYIHCSELSTAQHPIVLFLSAFGDLC